jgi:hypothetical protein
VYSTVLTTHSWLRWAVLTFGAIATLNAFRLRADAAERPRGQRWDWVFMLALDLEVLCGLLLYFGLSPYTSAAMSNIGLALQDPVLRFWAFTHAGTMCVALVAVRAGRVFAMGEPASPARRNGRYICFGIAVLAMLAGIPWPGLANARPLFRF